MKFVDRHYSMDLASHMAVCDANYLRLVKLFPALRDGSKDLFEVTVAGRGAEVVIEVLQRSPYTSLVRVRQLPDAPWGINPGFTVRLYHDARNAEVVEYQGARHFKAVYEYPNRVMRQRDEKAQVNRLLGEYLSYCLRNGAAVPEKAPAA